MDPLECVRFLYDKKSSYFKAKTRQVENIAKISNRKQTATRAMSLPTEIVSNIRTQDQPTATIEQNMKARDDLTKYKNSTIYCSNHISSNINMNSNSSKDCVSCPQGCQIQMNLHQLHLHLLNECPFRCAFCNYCKRPQLYSNLQNHTEECELNPNSNGDKNNQMKYFQPCNSASNTNKGSDMESVEQNDLSKMQDDYTNYRLDLMLQMSLRQKLALELEIAELKASLEGWKQKYNILEKQLLQMQSCQKNFLFPPTTPSEEDNKARTNNTEDAFAMEELEDKVNKIVNLVNMIDKDLKSAKANIYKTQNGQTTQIKKFKEYVTLLMDAANDAIAEMQRRHSTELQLHAEYLQKLETKDVHVGVLVWKVRKFFRLQHDAKYSHNQAILSQPFYTNEFGYKFCLELYPNGDPSGKGAFISLYLYIMKGGYDGIVKWPVQYKARLIVIDQLEGKRCFESVLYSENETQYVGRPMNDKNLPLGFSHFYPLSDLKPRYVINDVMFIKAIVTVTDISGSMISSNSNK